MFPNSRNNLCAWHVQQVLRKRFTFLNRGNDKAKKKLYRKIITLPLSEYSQDFEENYKFIIKDKNISKEQKDYLKNKVKEKKYWVKAYMKTHFCSGTCTTSRIESKHRLFKRFLNSASQLTGLFQVWKDLEEKEITDFKDEIEFFKKREEENMEKCELIQFFSEYSDYSIIKLKDQLIQSTNYKLNKKTRGGW